MSNTTSDILIGLNALSTRLGLPMYWLKREAVNGRLPHIRAGRRLLFNAAAVEKVLAERAAREGLAMRTGSGGA